MLSSELCRETLASEEYTPEEIEDEAAIIRVQLAYVNQISGDKDSALSMYRETLKNK